MGLGGALGFTPPDFSVSHSAPKCGFLKGNEAIVALLDRVKPEVLTLKEKCILVREPPSPLQGCELPHSSALTTLLHPAGGHLDPVPDPQNRGWQ